MLFAGKNIEEVYHETFKLLSAENDRGAVMIGGVLTDAILDDMIDKKLIQMPGKKHDSYRYEKKINMAFRLGIISEEMFNLLHGLRDARNKLAHRLVSDLNDNEVGNNIDTIFSAIPSLYKAYIESWNKQIKLILEEHNVYIDKEPQPNKRTRFNNYMSQIVYELYKISLTVTEIEKT